MWQPIAAKLFFLFLFFSSLHGRVSLPTTDNTTLLYSRTPRQSPSSVSAFIGGLRWQGWLWCMCWSCLRKSNSTGNQILTHRRPLKSLAEKKKKMFLWGCSSEDVYPWRYLRHLLVCKRRPFVEQIDSKDWKPSINVYTPWIRMMNGGENSKTHLDFFFFFWSTVKCMECNAGVEPWRVWKPAARSLRVAYTCQ